MAISDIAESLSRPCSATPIPAQPPTQAGTATSSQSRAATTLALSLYGVPLGLAGLGGGWSAASAMMGAPVWPGELLYALSAVLWLAFTGIYLWQGLAQRGKFSSDLRHPFAGPFVAFVPLVGVLLSAHYSEYLPVAGAWATVIFIAALAIVAAQLFAHWLTGGVTMATIHPGYFLPVVAGSFVASIGLSSVHLHEAAIAAFGAGSFFWLVIGGVVMVRLMTGGTLPQAAKPTLSAFLAPPATASIAWIVAHPGPMDAIQALLTGVLVIMVVVQVVLIGEYRRLAFSMAFWIFTFPVAASANYAIRWLAASEVAGWRVWAAVVLGAATVFVIAVGAATIVSLGRRKVRLKVVTATSS